MILYPNRLQMHSDFVAQMVFLSFFWSFRSDSCNLGLKVLIFSFVAFGHFVNQGHCEETSGLMTMLHVVCIGLLWVAICCAVATLQVT